MYSPEIIGSFLGQPGAYLHVPFCQKLCPFCPYNKVAYQTEIVRNYFAALQQEINTYIEQLDVPFTSLYIGGGTPTLCLDELESLISSIPVEGERAIEILPTHATSERIAQLKRMGINFISLGIQSFDQEMLRYLKRPNTREDNFQALDAVANQFDCVDVDLIFDVAFATEAVFLHDLEICFARGIEQVSTYPLMRFGYTPFGKVKHNSHREHELLHRAEELAIKYGYERRSVWTFNRQQAPNYTSITRPFYLGFGAGSASYTGRLFFVNHFGIQQYLAQIKAGKLPIARMFRLPPSLSSLYAVFWQSYTGAINLEQIMAYFGKKLLGWWRFCFNLLVQWQWLEQQGNIFYLTAKGRDHYHDLERWVTYHFIEPLWSEMIQEHRVNSLEQLEGKSWQYQLFNLFESKYFLAK